MRGNRIDGLRQPMRCPGPHLLGVFLFWCLFAPGTTWAASEGPATARPGCPPILDRVQELRLGNGMLFLLLARHDLPTVAGRVRFRVGSVDCPAGRSGLAHMFEHMAFKGTDSIGTKDYARERIVEDSVSSVGSRLAEEVRRRDQADTTRISRLRAELNRLTERQESLSDPSEWPRLYDAYTYLYNAWTSVDFTEYTATLPANDLEVWMLMESERIQHPSMREFYREREVVMEERRQSTEDSPEGTAEELLGALAFTAHPYRLPTIGYMSEIETLTQDDALAFRKIYYVPGNATGVLVGDFDPAQAERMIRDYFGDIPPGPLPPEVGTVEPAQKGMRRGTVRQGTEREIMFAFPGVPPGGRNALVAELLSDVLTFDHTSRLTQRLEIQDKAVRSVSSGLGNYSRYPGLFEITATSQEGFTNEQVEALIWEELDRVVKEPVSARKLGEIQASHRKRYFRGLETNDGLADALIAAQTIYGDWRRSYEDVATIQKISPDEVTALAHDIFRKDKATVVYLEPEESPQAGGTGESLPDAKGGAR
jgi:predicted Zn-dependent peptidase